MQTLDLVEPPLHAGHHLVRARAHQPRGLGDRRAVALQEFHRVLPGRGLDATQVASDAALADDLDGAYVAGRTHVGATAQLDRVADLQYAHDVAVLVTEERDRAEGSGFLLRGLEYASWCIGKRFAVGERLDPSNLVRRDCLVVAEVESQTVGADQ